MRENPIFDERIEIADIEVSSSKSNCIFTSDRVHIFHPAESTFFLRSLMEKYSHFRENSREAFSFLVFLHDNNFQAFP